MEGVKTYQDDAKKLQDDKLEEIREFLHKAADIKDPREMWYTVRDILNLLTLLIVPAPDVILPQDVPGLTTP